MLVASNIGVPWTHFNDTVPPHAIGAIILVTATLHNSTIQRILSVRPIIWLGRVSFSLYAVHIPIIFSIGSIVFLQMARNGHYNLGAIVSIVVTLTLSLALSEILTRFVDVPSQRFSKWLPKALSQMARRTQDQDLLSDRLTS